MGRVKDFAAQIPETEPTKEEVVSYEEATQFYDLKYRAFDTEVVQHNTNLINIVECMRLLNLGENTDSIIKAKANETILSCIALLKTEEDKEI